MELGDRIDVLEEKIDKIAKIVRRLADDRATARPSLPPPESLVRPRAGAPDVVAAGTRRGEVIRDAGLNEKPTFSLIAVPGEAVEVPDLFAGTRSQLVQLLEHPPELRRAGFDLTVGERAVVLPQGGRRALSPGYKVLELARDGVLIFAAEARDLLCWGTSNQEQPLRLNVLALAETTYLFADLVHRLTAHLQPQPETWRSVIGLQRMELDGKRAMLGSGPRGAVLQLMTRGVHVAPGTDFERQLPAISVAADPRIVAYRLRREVYVWFGWDTDAIPYTTAVGGELGTDLERIKFDGRGP
jgi:hypothetical protein